MTDQDIRDKELSELYRRIARGASPRALDARILAEAETALNSRSGNWMRPLALAATVILGVGVALRISDDTVAPTLDANEPAADVVQMPLESFSDTARTDLDKSVAQPANSLERDQIQQPENRPNQLEREPAPETETQAQAQSDIESVQKKVAGSRAPRIEDLTRKATEQARERSATGSYAESSPNQPSPSAVTPAAVFADGELDTGLALNDLEEQVAGPLCFDEMQSADSWLACIGSLTESGDTESAERSMEMFRGAHPEHPASKTR